MRFSSASGWHPREGREMPSTRPNAISYTVHTIVPWRSGASRRWPRVWDQRISRISLVSKCYKFPCAYFLLPIHRLLILACRQGALSISGLLDAIGLFTDGELVETETARFVTVGLDFATILSFLLIVLASFSPSFWCS